MCGIAGYLNPEVTNDMTLARRVTAMTEAIAYRGPDDEGIWFDEQLGLALGHRRLSVQDVSHAGHQPMVSADGRWIIVYNGDTYNPELRKRLTGQGIVFRGHSDTEVMLEAISQDGITIACQQFIGKFAFAAWDRQERCLYLARDRFGIKPLYWGEAGRCFFFASELKSIHTLPEFQPKMNQKALASYLRFGYVPTPMSIFEGVHKIEPGHILKLPMGGRPEETPYWTLIDQIMLARSQGSPVSYEDAVDDLDDLLTDSVSRRLTADVPVGTLLSGGIDSSVVTAIAQKVSSTPIKTFSVGFDVGAFNEAQHAKLVAAHLGTEHTELYMSSRQALDVVPHLSTLYDEPFADSSQIPTHLVCRLAQKSVTVALTGDGGDEVFAGYNRYTWGQKLWKLNQKLPMKGAVCSLLRHTPDNLLSLLTHLIPASRRPQHLSSKIHMLEKALGKKSMEDLYTYLVSQWSEPRDLIPHAQESIPFHFSDLGVTDPIEQMQVADMLTYMMDDILTKVDRASMSVPLMTRIPLLDHRLVEWAWGLPLEYKIQGNKGKRILRDVLYRYVPQELIDRPKMGFGTPIGQWLRGDLRDWAEDLLSERALKDTLEPSPVRKLWAQHLKGQDWDNRLWPILMLQAWRRQWMTNTPSLHGLQAEGPIRLSAL